ncbi:MAG: SGNH/GDSL hydrolase family protein [Synergistaceae bacterium]|nr:SGNH/GDSL hydrolase family protein [Synergistaceae bacterium]
MKKFLTKIFAYAVILAAVTLAVNACYLWTTRGDNAMNVPDGGIEICNFGSSHGQRGFNYEDFAGRYVCSNFGLSSQSLLYDYRILQFYRDKIRNGAAVFITMSYFSLFGKPEVEGESFLSKNRRYYKFLPKELILAYDWKTDLYDNYLPVLNPNALKVLVKRMLHIGEKAKLFQENFNLYDEGWNIITTSEDAAQDAPQAYGRHISHRKDDAGVRMRRHESFEALYGMIRLCRELGARPILVTVPYTRDYTDTIKKNDPEFFGEFYAEIEEIKRNTGIEYYDYGFDERFCDAYELFINSDHLNREGARKFTDILLSEVLGITS